MAITVTELTTGAQSAVADPDSASITPTANRPVFAAYVSGLYGGTAPTHNVPTGAGLTWELVDTATFTDGATITGRLSLYRGVNASPSTGAVAFDSNGVSQPANVWAIAEVEDGSTVVQSVDGTGTGTTAGVTLTAFADGDNVTLAVAVAIASVTADSPLTGLTSQAGAEGFTVRMGYRLAEDTTPSFTIGSSAGFAVIGAEVAASGGGGGITIPIASYYHQHLHG